MKRGFLLTRSASSATGSTNVQSVQDEPIGLTPNDIFKVLTHWTNEEINEMSDDEFELLVKCNPSKARQVILARQRNSSSIRSLHCKETECIANTPKTKINMYLYGREIRGVRLSLPGKASNPCMARKFRVSPSLAWQGK